MNSSAKIIIHPSKGLTAYLLMLGAFACSCVLYALPFLLSLFMLPGIFFYSRRLIREHALRQVKHAIVQLEYRGGKRWTLKTASLHNWQVTYKGCTFRTSWLVIACFVGNRRNFTVVIPKDAISKQTYTDLLAKLWI